MTELLDYNLLLPRFQVFLLVFVRITTVVVSAPVFGSRLMRVPPQLIAGLGGALSLVVMMNIPESVEFPGWGLYYAAHLAGEALVGLSLGFLATLILVGIQFGGEVIDHLIGFAVVQVIDPVTNESASLIGNLKGLLSTVLFLLLDGHHLLFQGLLRTFEVLPPGGVNLLAVATPGHGWFERVTPLMESYGELIFVVGTQVAAPCLLVMTLLWVPEAFLARMIPQLNLLINDVPFRIALGLFLVWLGLAPFVDLVQNLLGEVAVAADQLTLLLAGA